MWWMPFSFMRVSPGTAGAMIACATISRTRPSRLGSPMQFVANQLMRPLGPVAQDRARVARVDDLLHAEALRRAERRGHGLEPRGDLLAEPRWVLGRLELAPVGRLGAARHGQRAPVARRPGETHVQPRAVAVAGARHAVYLAHEDRHP